MNSHWSPFSSDSLIIIKFNPTKKKFASNMEGCDQPFEAILKTYISVPGSIRPSLFWIYTFIDLQFIVVKTKLKVLFFLFWGSCLSCCSHSIVVFKFFICVFIFMSDCQPCFLTSSSFSSNYLLLYVHVKQEQGI